MRKLTLFFIILFAAVFAVTLLCAADWPPGIKTAVVGGLNWGTNGIYATLASTWFALGQIVGATGLNFLIATLTIFFIGVFSGGFLIRTWQNKAPKALGGQKTATGSTITLQTNPPPTPPQIIKVKQEEKTEAATA